MKREINIPVRALVEHSMRSGDLVLEFSGVGRAMDGLRAHQKIQGKRPSEYESEVSISLQLETEKFIVKVGGRMDGIYIYPDRVIIDEIKTTARKLEYFETNPNPLHWGQVKVYAYIYALQQDLMEIETQLTYYQLDEGKTREFNEVFSLEQLTEFFNKLLTAYLVWAETLDDWKSVRDESIKNLSFPFTNYRPGQREMALSIYYAIERNEQLMVEAPTGIGKTMAAIFPAVKAMGKGLVLKTIYLTAKTTGRTVAQKALQDMRKKGLMFKALTLTAKDKVCFNREKACNGEECEYARGYYDRINEAVMAAFETEALTRETIESFAREYMVCPFEFSLDLALWVDAVICDYNYAFDPRVYIRRFFGEDSFFDKGFVFLTDEANNLVDRAREMFSAELWKRPFLDLRKQVKKDVPEMYRVLGKINSRMVTLKKECEEAGVPISMENYPDDLSGELRKFVRVSERWLVREQGAAYRQEVLDLYFAVNWFLKVMELYDSRYATCLETVERDFRLKLFCIDPSLNLSEALLRCKSAVFFSATLSPMEYFQGILGLGPETRRMVLPSPFPRENLCIPVADRVSTLFRYRDKTKISVAGLIRTLVEELPGNYLVFFPSYRYMKMVYEVFLLMDTDVEILLQEPGMSEEDREEFLDHFTVENLEAGRTLVGFAVMGGIFGEGIDLVGDRLSGAVVVGVGLPGISLERELIKDYYGNLLEMGFEYAYLFPGLNRVFQAAGRVIRTDEDRGVVLLVGARFSTYQYRSLFPGHWQPIKVRDEEQLKTVLHRFQSG